MAKKRELQIEQPSLSREPAAKKARISPDLADTPTETPSTPASPTSTPPRSIPETSATSTTKTRYRPKKYLCTYSGCVKAFNRPVHLEAHIRTHTNDRCFKCEEPDCDKAFFKSSHLKAHIQNNHTSSTSFVCRYVISVQEDGKEIECTKAFTTSSRLKKHVAAHQEKEDLKCNEIGCGMIFRKLDTLQRHVKQIHFGEAAWRCEKSDECGEVFNSAGRLRTHELRVHGGVRFFCEYCSPTMSLDNMSTPANPASISEEPVGFTTYNEYQAHLKIAHPPTCTLCNTVCVSNRALSAHMEIEHATLASRQRFLCDYPGCGRGFTRNGNLVVHVRNVHHKEDRKVFECGVVDLSGEERCPGWHIASGERDGVSEVGQGGCGEKFATKLKLIKHVRKAHLGMQTRPTRTKMKSKKSTATIKGEGHEPIPASVLPTSPSKAATMKAEATDSLSFLTGHSYAVSRPLACWNKGCEYRFSREYDLSSHMELEHGWHVDDINDGLLEKNALGGKKFWLGGLEEISGVDDGDDSMEDFDYGVDDDDVELDFGFESNDAEQMAIDPLLAFE